MKFPALATTAAACALVLSGCAASMDDASLMKTVPVGAGTSHIAIYPFIECVKAKWSPQASGKLRQYTPDSDGQVLAVRGATSGDSVLLYAQPSAAGTTGYTIYGDVVAASRYVAAAHTCD
jgi:hypothetical protein